MRGTFHRGEEVLCTICGNYIDVRDEEEIDTDSVSCSECADWFRNEEKKTVDLRR